MLLYQQAGVLVETCNCLLRETAVPVTPCFPAELHHAVLSLLHGFAFAERGAPAIMLLGQKEEMGCCALCRPLDQQKMEVGESKVWGNGFTISITSDFSKPEFLCCEQRNTGKAG